MIIFRLSATLGWIRVPNDSGAQIFGPTVFSHYVDFWSNPSTDINRAFETKSTGRRTLQQQGPVLERQEFQEDRFLHLVKHSDYGGDHGTATTTTIYYNETTTFNNNNHLRTGDDRRS